jgi:hypothetical protein
VVLREAEGAVVSTHKSRFPFFEGTKVQTNDTLTWRRHSVYRMAAAGSWSKDPKLPWPAICNDSTGRGANNMKARGSCNCLRTMPTLLEVLFAAWNLCTKEQAGRKEVAYAYCDPTVTPLPKTPSYLTPLAANSFWTRSAFNNKSN